MSQHRPPTTRLTVGTDSVGVPATRRRPRATRDRSARDAGITLVEIVMSVVISSIIGGVLVATLSTSLNAANSASSTISSSIDTQLITTFLAADAQAAGGTDPTTAAVDLALGVSSVNDVTGWAGCPQSGTLAVRFSWKDRSASATDTVVATYAVLSDGSFVRRTCDSTGTSQAVLGRGVSGVTVTCSPFGTCTGLPDVVSLRLQGGDVDAPFDITVTASLRPQLQEVPSLLNSAQAPLVVTGTATCPVLSLGATSVSNVLGDAIVASACGASPIDGVLTSFGLTGSLSLLPGFGDPLSSSPPPASCSGVTGTNPTIGSSSAPSAVTVYPNAVTVTGTVVFQPGRHVFCNGLTIAAGASVAGTGVLLYVASGAVSVDGGSTVTLSPATSGPYAGTVLWSAATQAVTITGGADVDQLSGVVYVPRATLAVNATSGVRLGAVVAERVSIGGTGPVRIGLPIPDLTVAPSALPAATVGQLYTATAPAVTGGTAPVTYTAVGLPSGLAMTGAGAITGTPLSVGSFDVSFLAIDATGASVAFTRTISVTGIAPAPTTASAVPGDTTAAVSWTPGTAGAIATTGYAVTATAAGFPTRTCTGGPSATSCTLTGLTNGVRYAIGVTASSLLGTSPAATTSVTPRPAVLVGTDARLWLDATDPDGDGVSEGTAESCDAATACTSTSNRLTRWEDKSGANSDAVQTTSSMAGTYVPGLPAVNFDANGWYQATIASGPDLTVFVVAQSDTATWNTWGWLLSSRRTNGVIIHPWPGGTLVGWYATNAGGSYLSPTQSSVGTITSPHLYDHAQTGSNPIVGTSFLDGHPLGTLTFTGQTRNVTSMPVRIGADDTGGRFGDGKYREVIVLSRSLTATERRAVQEYLARKWSVAITPSAPTDVSALGADGGALVAWAAPTWNGGSSITGYTVTALPGGATCSATAPTTSCAVTGLTNGTPYSFVVTALNAIGTGDQSAPSNTITPGPPPAPTAPAATPGSRQVAVSWTAPVLNGHAPLTGYIVTATAPGRTTRTCTATPPTTSCTVTGLDVDVTYSFAVVAANAHGNGPAVTVTAMTAWTPPTLGSALTWWFDASDPSALTGSWVAQSGFTVTGSAGSTQLRASAGVIERVDVLDGGTGYTASPDLTFSGGGGSGGSAGGLTVTAGVLSLPNVYDRGSGFHSEPSVVAAGGGGTGARYRARIMVPVTVGTTIRLGGQTYTVVDRDGLNLTVSPALAADASASTIEEWQVSRWRNLAPGATLDARQTTSSQQPVLGAMAGRPAVVFDGIDQLLWLLDPAGGQTFDHGPNWTAVVAYQAERQVSRGAVGQQWNAINTRILASSGGALYDWQSAENIEIDPVAGTDSVTGGPVRVGVDAGNGSDTYDWDRVYIGSLASTPYTPGWSFGGAVGEVIFVDGGLDSTAVADATAYLTRKWSQPNIAPSAPINVTATPGDGGAVVDWRAANPFLAPPVTGYTVTATATGRATSTCTTSGALTCTLTGLTNGAPYTVTVTATSSVGTGTPSVPITLVARPALLAGSNARLWLDAADIDGDGWIEGSASETNVFGGAVQTWIDKSGRSNHVAAPSTATRPGATTQTMNGLPVITFNGSTGLFGTSAANPYGITTDRTLFVVTRRRSGAPSRLIDRIPEDNPLFDITGDNRLEVRADNGGQYQSSIGSIGSTPNAVTVLSAHRSGTSVGIWSNGVLSGASTITGNNTQRALVIGRHVAWTQASDHDVAEVLLFDRALTATERRTVEEYLAVKWGVGLLPTAPASVTATQSDRAVTVSWSAVSGGTSPVSAYTVTASPGGATCTTGTTSCSLINLTPGASYTFTVTATNATGTGPASTATATLVRNQIVDGTTLVAYGMRRLTPSYVGPLVQVRRSSDGATADIGSTATGDLDTAQLTSFVGSGSATVSIWYDQSGNGRNATVSTASTEPRLVTAGVVHTVNGRPAVSFNGSSDALQSAVPGPNTPNLVASFVAVSTVSSGSNTWGRPLTLGRPGINAWFTAGNVTFTRYAGTNRFGVENQDAGYSFGSSATSVVTNGVAFGYSAEFSAGRHRGAFNGTPTADFAPLNAADTWNFTHLRMGQDMQMNGDTWLNGSVGEVVVGTTSFTGYRNVVEGSMQGYYGLS